MRRPWWLLILLILWWGVVRADTPGQPPPTSHQTDGTQKTQLVDPMGEATTVNDGGLTTQTYMQAISEGIIPGHEIFSKIGYGPASTASRTTLWNPGTEYVFPSEVISVEAVSTGAQDLAVTGTGARTVHLVYLDGSYAQKSFTFNMNGVTPVAGPTDFFRVNSFHIETGSNAAGIISLRLVGGAATVYSQMPAGYTRSRNSVYTVPLGKVLYVQDVQFSAAYSTAGKAVRMTLHASKSPDGTVSTTGLLFWPQFETMMMDNNAPYPKSSPLMFAEKTDLKVSVIGETNAQTTSEISGWIENAN